MIQIRRNTAYTQAYGCRFCLHIGSLAIYFGQRKNGSGPRLEILTPYHWWRWSRGYTDRPEVVRFNEEVRARASL